jgi:hypothetical protein
MISSQRTLRRLLAVVLLASAALFAVGSHIERSKESHAEAPARPSEAQHASRSESHAGETGAERRSESGDEAGKPATGGGAESRGERREETHREAKLFGIDPEAVGLVIAAVVASLLLGFVTWMRRIGVVLVAIAGFGLIFAAFDVREVLHQVDESRTNLIVIASVLIGLHLLAAVLAGAALLGGRPPRQAARA